MPWSENKLDIPAGYLFKCVGKTIRQSTTAYHSPISAFKVFCSRHLVGALKVKIRMICKKLSENRILEDIKVFPTDKQPIPRNIFHVHVT